MFFKNIRAYRLKHLGLDAAALNDSLAKLRYAEASEITSQNMGWVSPCEFPSHELVHAVEGQYLIALRTDKRLLPSSVVNKQARLRAAEIEQQQGYKPGRKQMKEIKELVTDELLPKAFVVTSDVYVWIDTVRGWLAVDSASAAKVDDVMGMLAKCLDPFPVEPLYTELSPAAAMTQWLVADESPESFSIDQEAELQSSSESRATVKYVRQSVQPSVVQQHVVDGKQVTRLAMTWNDRVSFVLTDDLVLKRITPLDVLKEQAKLAQPEDQAELFSGEFLLMAGELGNLFNELVEALGGEKPKF